VVQNYFGTKFNFLLRDRVVREHFFGIGIRFGRMDGRTHVNLEDYSVTLAQQSLLH